MSPDDDVGFLEQLYFPIRFSFSDTTLLHKQWWGFFLEILLKFKGKTPGWRYIGQCLLSTRDRSNSKGSHLDTLLSSIKLFSNFVLTNASNVSKGQRNFGILVTSQCLEWIPIMLQCTHCYTAQLNNDIEQFCVDSLVKYFKRSIGEFWNSCFLDKTDWHE